MVPISFYLCVSKLPPRQCSDGIVFLISGFCTCLHYTPSHKTQHVNVRRAANALSWQVYNPSSLKWEQIEDNPGQQTNPEIKEACMHDFHPVVASNSFRIQAKHDLQPPQVETKFDPNEFNVDRSGAQPMHEFVHTSIPYGHVCLHLHVRSGYYHKTVRSWLELWHALLEIGRFDSCLEHCMQYMEFIARSVLKPSCRY